MQKYKISKTTVYDIKKSELKLTKFVDSTEKDVKKFSQVKNPLYENVDKAVNIWYESQRLSGVPIRGIELQTAASHFASKLNNPTFKASGGWLSRYRARHNLKNKKVVGEALSADEDAANRFKDDFHKLMTDEKYEQFQIYNADETGVYWKSLPDNSQVKNANSASGHKQSKDRLSVLLCANADASHKNVLAVVGKSKRPRAIKNIIGRLPVHYYSSHKAWFNKRIFSEWFFKRFINEVRNFQENKLRVAPDQVKALLLVDNSPAHPTELISNDGNIKCKFLPPNTTSVLQPLDQGVIAAFKRLYKRRQLESCLVFSSDADQPNNSVGEQTFSNLKKYDIKKAIFNFGNSWDELKSFTIRNGWKILLEHKNNSDLETAGDALQLSEDESDEDEQEIRRLEQLFQRARIEVNQESINEWIDIDLDDPGHNVLSNDDIVEAVLSEKMEISSSDDSSSTSEDSLEPDVPRCEALKSLDVALKYLEKRTEPEMLASYNTINSLRTMLMREEEALLNKPKKQTTISNFFAKPKLTWPSKFAFIGLHMYIIGFYRQECRCLKIEYPGGKNQHFRHLLCFAFHRGQKAAEAARDISNLYVKGDIGKRAPQKWFAKFKNGDLDLEDTPRSGRPSEFVEEHLKALLKVDGQTTRVLYWEMLERNATLNKNLYIAQLHRVNEAIQQKRPDLQVVNVALQELEWEVLQHPPYSPDLAPTDYHLFRSMSEHMRGTTFDDKEDLKTWLNNFFDTRPGDIWRNGINKLVERWEEVLNNNGEYIID
ncbi:hypothetical protein LAZ67_1007092 [Cordylochernes scorpioides]|uniref:HTH CENPB-type domain-containing protein n=1 Tax=Cordylochernes scorpioides TaxID=51811 RepID=A0ABY6K0J4_9ARAC|nr:hypothetical protein LAZ67_1007092 [Cordylochernes scorpioides]